MMLGILIALTSLLVVSSGLVWWFRRIRQVEILENRFPFIFWMATGVILALFAICVFPGWITVPIATVSLLPALFLFVQLTLWSRQETNGSIEVGDSMPSFEAPDEDGVIFSSTSLSGHPVLFKFFRGHW